MPINAIQSNYLPFRYNQNVLSVPQMMINFDGNTYAKIIKKGGGRRCNKWLPCNGETTRRNLWKPKVMRPASYGIDDLATAIFKA